MLHIQTIKAWVQPATVVLKAKTHQIETRLANGFLTRLRGLLCAKPLGPAEGLLLSPCKSIHTIGMAYSIDVVFLSPDMQIVSIVTDCKANRFESHKDAKHTLELLAGQAAKLDLKDGMQLSILPFKQTTGIRNA